MSLMLEFFTNRGTRGVLNTDNVDFAKLVAHPHGWDDMVYAFYRGPLLVGFTEVSQALYALFPYNWQPYLKGDLDFAGISPNDVFWVNPKNIVSAVMAIHEPGWDIHVSSGHVVLGVDPVTFVRRQIDEIDGHVRVTRSVASLTDAETFLTVNNGAVRVMTWEETPDGIYCTEAYQLEGAWPHQSIAVPMRLRRANFDADAPYPEFPCLPTGENQEYYDTFSFAHSETSLRDDDPSDEYEAVRGDLVTDPDDNDGRYAVARRVYGVQG